MSKRDINGMCPRDKWLACNPGKTPKDYGELIRQGRARGEAARLTGLTHMTDEKRKADQRERKRRSRQRKRDEMAEREIRSMLIVVTPDGRHHGQHLTDGEAAELCRRLLEIREQAEPEHEPEPKATPPAPKRNAAKRKGAGAKRGSGGGRKPSRLDGPEMSRIIALRQEGKSLTAIARETRHSVPLIRRELARMSGS